MTKKSDSEAPPSRMTESEWRDISQLVKQSIGIKLSEAKRVFLASRLLKRLRATGVRSFREYLQLVMRSEAYSGEHQELVNAVTTNKTDFFREPEHFEVLRRWLGGTDPRIRQARLNGIRIWCAAASTGEEPYTIASVLRDELTPAEYERARVVASDIDTHVLESARRGVYDRSAAEEDVDKSYRAKMFVQGAGDFRDKLRVRRELREKVHFVQQNLVLPQWKVGKSFDVVFCRNVLIYFDRPTQQQVVRRLLEHVEPHGLLFLGHSESFNSLSITAKAVAHSVCSPVTALSLRAPKVPTFASRAPSKRPGVLPFAPRVPSRLPPAPSQPPGVQAESLRVGESRLESPQWLSITLDRSLLLLLYSEKRKIAMVSHLELKTARPLARRIREVTRSMLELLRVTDAKEEHLRAKVVLDDATLSAEVSSELTRLGIRVATTKVVYTDACVWIEPHSERILLRKPSTRRRGSPPLPHSGVPR